MPRHKQVTTCCKTSEAVSNFCTCLHCTLSVCQMCGSYEGGLTTDCPGTKVDFDKRQEVYETNLDYTDERGWHLGEPLKLRVPRFEDTKLPPELPRADSRAVVAPSINWATVDHIEALQHALSQKAIAWVLADRICESRLASLERIKDEIAVHLPKAQEPNARAQELLNTLEYEKVNFHHTSQSAEKCDEEFRQAARKLVAALEEGQSAATSSNVNVKRAPGS